MIQFVIRATWVFRSVHLTGHIHCCKKIISEVKITKTVSCGFVSLGVRLQCKVQGYYKKNRHFQGFILTEVLLTNKQTPWSESARELNRPSDSRLSAK
jgi:hypothetical protein